MKVYEDTMITDYVQKLTDKMKLENSKHLLKHLFILKEGGKINWEDSRFKHTYTKNGNKLIPESPESYNILSRHTTEQFMKKYVNKI